MPDIDYANLDAAAANAVEDGDALIIFPEDGFGSDDPPTPLRVSIATLKEKLGANGGTTPTPTAAPAVKWGRLAATPTTQAEIDALPDSATGFRVSASYSTGDDGDVFVIALPDGYTLTHINDALNVDELSFFTHDAALNIWVMDNLNADAEASLTLTSTGTN